MDIEFIAVIGDSAGGQLAFNLAAWMIENKQRRVDALYLLYPVLEISDKKRFSPSYFEGLDDNVFPCFADSGMRFYYVPEGMGHQLATRADDHYLNPVDTKDELLAEFPPTYFYTCFGDQLRDNQVDMAYRLNKVGKLAKMNMFMGLRHGAYEVLLDSHETDRKSVV